jgi:Predicted transcriptional regulator with C-terminal CBS domains
MTQAKLADLLEISSPEYISKMESGKIKPNLNRLDQICEIFGVKLEYLVTGVIKDTPEYYDENIQRLLENCPKEKYNRILKFIKFEMRE